MENARIFPLLAIILFLSLSFSYQLYNGALYCNTTCDDCEECDVNECILPSDACLSDSGCIREGETCFSCSCTPPECVVDGDCTSEGEICENYECVGIPPEPESPPNQTHPLNQSHQNNPQKLHRSPNL